ncbi:serine hydrolase [Nisaea acidiphila]|uniref:Serine hydrolase n=1 Tax=Nisaea acidiphila TaxID=1862145 RepID=A0A9J7ATM0_9PROT|nr:serine hydrolase [Nisaea acidiphila]UUX48717.1 serine hydrolase [Nisaea acidiphila]
MPLRRLSIVAAALLVPALILGYLVATGERGLSSRRASSPFPPRDVPTNRMDPQGARELGWSSDGLDRVLDYLARLSADSFVLMTDGQTVASLGDLAVPYSIHSARKALLSAVVGQHVGDGPNEIPLDATLAELGIDDDPPPLTPLQRQATVLHLLKSMSGINHPAAAEGGLTADKERRLGDGENQPGTIWAYNNWDYNALTTIFERRTGVSVSEGFRAGIAEPVGMQDFTPESASYIVEPARSRHRAAMFRMSARDLARFGQLFLDRGVVDDRSIMPVSWVDRIAADYAETGIEGLRAGHGYLWWIPSRDTGLPEGSFCAWGLGQQTVFVIPAWSTVIIHQSDTTEFLKRWLTLQEEGMDGDAALERIVMDCRMEAGMNSAFCREHRFTTRREFNRLIGLIVDARG